LTVLVKDVSLCRPIEFTLSHSSNTWFDGILALYVVILFDLHMCSYVGVISEAITCSPSYSGVFEATVTLVNVYMVESSKKNVLHINVLPFMTF